MTKQKAIKEMKHGKRITHPRFVDGAWMAITTNGMIIFDDGVMIRPESFWIGKDSKEWEDGYEIFKP